MTEPIDLSEGAVNPYAAVGGHQPQSVAADLRPTGVTVIGVMSGIGGVLAILGSGLVALQLAVGAMFAGAMTPPGTAGKIQAEYMAQIQEVTNRFLIPNIALAVTHAVIGVLMIVGAVKLLRRRPHAAAFVRRILLALIVFELVRIIPNVMMQLQIYPLTEAFTQKLTTGQGNGGPPPAMMKSIQQVSVIVGFVFAAGWLIVKLALVIWARIYLNRQTVADYFAGADSDAQNPR